MHEHHIFHCLNALILDSKSIIPTQLFKFLCQGNDNAAYDVRRGVFSAPAPATYRISFSGIFNAITLSNGWTDGRTYLRTDGTL